MCCFVTKFQKIVTCALVHIVIKAPTQRLRLHSSFSHFWRLHFCLRLRLNYVPPTYIASAFAFTFQVACTQRLRLRLHWQLVVEMFLFTVLFTELFWPRSFHLTVFIVKSTKLFTVLFTELFTKLRHCYLAGLFEKPLVGFLQ